MNIENVSLKSLKHNSEISFIVLLYISAKEFLFIVLVSLCLTLAYCYTYGQLDLITLHLVEEEDDSAYHGYDFGYRGGMTSRFLLELRPSGIDEVRETNILSQKGDRRHTFILLNKAGTDLDILKSELKDVRCLSLLKYMKENFVSPGLSVRPYFRVSLFSTVDSVSFKSFSLLLVFLISTFYLFFVFFRLVFLMFKVR